MNEKNNKVYKIALTGLVHLLTIYRHCSSFFPLRKKPDTLLHQAYLLFYVLCNYVSCISYEAALLRVFSVLLVPAVLAGLAGSVSGKKFFGVTSA